MVFSLSIRFFLLFTSFDDELVVFLFASHVDLRILLFHSSLATTKGLGTSLFFRKPIHHMHYDRVVAECLAFTMTALRIHREV